MDKKKLLKQSKMWCPKELNYIVDCKNKHCSIEEMAECWKPILDKNELEEAFTKALIAEKLENEIKRIEIEYKNDEDLSYEYLEGLTSGLRNVSKVCNKWLVQMQINGVNTCLKRFPLEQLKEAGAYAAEMRSKHYGIYEGVS